VTALETTMPIGFSCDGCGKSYQVDDSLAGKRVKCKSCAFIMNVPAPTRTPPPRGSASPANRPELKSFGAPEPPQASAKPRPSPSAPGPSNIYGLDEEVMEEAARPSYDDEFDAPPMRRPGKVKARRNQGVRDGSIPGFSGPMLWVNLVFLGLIILLGLASLATPVAFPFFVIVAGLTALALSGIAFIWFLKISFGESAACGLMFLFLPFYSLYYLISRWPEMKRPFLINLIGGGVYLYALMITGVVISKAALQPGEPGQPARAGQFQTAEQLQRALPATAPVPGFIAAPVAPPVQNAVTSSAGSWRAQADPPAEKLVWPVGNGLVARIPPSHNANARIIVPAVASPFVILGGNEAEDQFREVWDLREPGTPIGRVPGKYLLQEPFLLSPDGANFAGHEISGPGKLVIFATATGQPIGAISDGDNIPDIGEFIGTDQLMLGTTYKQAIRIWNFKTGQVIRDINLGARIIKESLALSPGRRYLALSTASPERIKLIDLTSGQVVGDDILPKDGNTDYGCEGLAFSPDGTMLTGLFGCGFNAAHLVTWDVAGGKRLSDFRFPGYQPFKPEYGYMCRAVKWLPDGSGWLMRDKVVVERESGTIIWSMPFEPRNGLPAGPRILMDSGRMIAFTGKSREEMLRVLPLPREKIEAASGIARSGGDVSDAVLPKVHEIDVGSVKTIPPPVTKITWLVRPDPLPKPRKPFSLKPAPLTAKMDQIQTIRFSSPTAAMAFVSSGPGTARGGENTATQGEKPGVVERINLTTAHALNQFEIPPICQLAAVSPDGSAVAVLKNGNHDRIDIYNATDGSHIVGFRPYESAAEPGNSIVSCNFVDANQILTASGDGTLTLWALPECRAVYSMERVATGPVVFSPAHKWAAMISGAALRLIDAATGTIKGEVPLPSNLSAQSGLAGAAFRQDGAELAAILNGEIVRFDLTKGEVVESVPIPYAAAGTLEYAATGHLLIDKQALFDLSKQKVVWIYDGGSHATGSPNGAHWFATGRPFDKASLTFKLFPDAGVARSVAAAFDVKTKSMLGAGTTVSIQIDGQPPRDPDTFRNEILHALSQQLEAIGATVADDGPTRLLVRIRDNPTGKNLHFRRTILGRGNVQHEDIDIPERTLEYDLSVQDQKGTAIPLQSDKYRTSPGMFVALPRGETDIDMHLRMGLWNQAKTRLLSLGLPFFVARSPGGPIVILPGLTRLNPTLR